MMTVIVPTASLHRTTPSPTVRYRRHGACATCRWFSCYFGICMRFIRWNSLLWYFCINSSFVVFRCPGSDDWVVSGGDCHFKFWIHRGILRTFRKFWTMTMTIDRDQNKSSTLVATLLSQIQTNKIMRAGLGILSIKSTYITSCCGPEQVVCSRNTHQLLL